MIPCMYCPDIVRLYLPMLKLFLTLLQLSQPDITRHRQFPFVTFYNTPIFVWDAIGQYPISDIVRGYLVIVRRPDEDTPLQFV